MPSELTSVADDEAVVHVDGTARVYDGLTPGTEYAYDGHEFRTFPDLGERLATVATVNDVHFGETICGVLESYDGGPTFSTEPGDDPYPDVMNRSVIADIEAIAPDAVVAKGDLTTARRTATAAPPQQHRPRPPAAKRARSPPRSPRPPPRSAPG